ncbi:hypothetical protein BBJ28_00013079 [Nothophytophthora sp. Chile5]|nr:hypothetical protein BBJ28_00013079 [Nothophytophthora sp. Chile5]
MEKPLDDAYIQMDEGKLDRRSAQEAIHPGGHDTAAAADTEIPRNLDAPAPYPLEVSMEDACDSISQDRKIGRALVRLVSTVIFCCFAAVALSRRPRTTLQWKQVLAVSSVLATKGDKTVTADSPIDFFNIGNVDDVYDWLTDTLVPSIFITEDINDVLLPTDERGRVANLNKVLGGVIIDVTRKSVGPCNPNDVVVALYPNCGDADSTTLERSFLDINLNATEAAAAIVELKANGKGIDYYTEKLVATVATYNSEFQGYSLTTLKLKFQESGYIKPTSATNSARATPYQWKDATADAIYVLAYIAWLVVIFYWGTERKTKHLTPKPRTDTGSSARRLFRNLWRACVLGGSVPVFAALWAVLECKVNADAFRSNLQKLADNNWESDEEALAILLPVVDLLDSLTDWTYALALVGAIVAIQLGLYTLFQLSFHPQLSIFTRTMSSALRQFAAFFVVWLIAFGIFVCVGSILFGSDVEEFSTRLRTMQACINMLFGTFDYDSIKDLQFAFIYYWCFMVVVSLVLLNLMLAIVLDAYDEVRKESYKGKASLMLDGRINGFCLDTYHRKKYARCSQANAKPRDDDLEAADVFERLGADASKLTNDYVVLRGKIDPWLLLQVVQAKMDQEGLAARRRTSNTQPPSKLTMTALVEMFPAANLTRRQLRATFKYLHEGLLINKSAIKKRKMLDEEQAKADEEERGDHSNDDDDGRSSFLTPSEATLSEAARVVALERKLDRLLAEVLSTRAAIREAMAA